MRFREVKEVKEIKETNSRDKGLGVASKLDIIEGREPFMNIKPEGVYSTEDNERFWKELFQKGVFG